MADNSIRVDTPDPKKYHQNVGGIPGTMIPRSGKDGQSLAFDPNKPQTVIVDPGEEGGGFQLDISELSKAKSRFNSAAVRSEVLDDPSIFYRELSKESAEKGQLKEELTTKLQEKLKEPTVPEPIQPINALPSIVEVHQPANPVPPEMPPSLGAVPDPTHDLPDEATMEKMANNFDTEGAIQKLLEEEKMKEAMKQPDPEMQQIKANLNQQGAAINSLIGAVNKLIQHGQQPAPASAPSNPAHVVRAEEEVEAEMKQEAADVEKSAFESLQIPFLNNKKPTRPQYETYFEMGKLGTMAARYHAVVPGQDCLALVYDTRFEDGFQYLPPNLGEERVTVSVPKLDNATYSCSSLGLHWSLGCLDIVILIKHGDME